jgi:hypothetical protein
MSQRALFFYCPSAVRVRHFVCPAPARPWDEVASWSYLRSQATIPIQS